MAAIRRGEEPSGPSAWDGYAAAAVCEAAVASLESGRPVDVSALNASSPIRWNSG